MKQTIVLILVPALILATRAIAARKPNTVLLFADEAGKGDSGFQGSHRFKTPHLDRSQSPACDCRSSM